MAERQMSPIEMIIGGLFPPKDTTRQITDWTKYGEEDTWQFIEDLINTTNLTNTTGQTATSGATNVTPTMTPQAEQFISQLTDRFSQQTKPVDISGIRQQGIQDINTSSDVQREAVNNIMASRGLSTSPVAGVSESNVEAQRLGQINQFTNSLPALQNQLNLGNLAAASSFMSAIPKGTSTDTVSQASNIGQTSQAGQQTGGRTTRGTRDVNEKGYQNVLGSSQAGRNWGQVAGGLAGGLGNILASLFG